MKVFGIALTFLAWIFITNWVANHINTWIGLALFVLGIVGTLYLVERSNKNN